MSRKNLASLISPGDRPRAIALEKRACLEATGWTLRDGANILEVGAMDEVGEVFEDLDDPRMRRAGGHQQTRHREQDLRCDDGIKIELFGGPAIG